MIKFVGKNDEGSKLVIGLGLSRKNVDRLTSGHPIKVKLSELNIGLDGNVLIFFGETEEEMARLIEPMIGPATKVHVDPKLKN